MPNLTSKQWTLIFLGVTVLLIVLLAAGITGLNLEPGEPFSYNSDPTQNSTNPFVPNGELLVAFFRGLLAFSIILLPLYIILLIFDKRARKRLLTDIPLILLMLLALYLMRDVAAREPAETEFPESALNQESAELFPEQLSGQFAEEIPDSAVSAATITVAVAIAAAAGGLFWFIRRNLLKPRPVPVDAIADEAQDALDTLYAGGDLQETIQLCYKRMLEAVAKQRNLLRHVDMTPHEFGQHLIEHGLPARPVRELTELFEQARYSHRQPGPKEHQQAIHSLSSIIAAIRNPGPTA